LAQHFASRGKVADRRGAGPFDRSHATIVLKDIIGARNQRRRELRSTLTERQAMVDALLGLRAGADQEPLPIPPEPSPRASEPQRPRLKRYNNE
jgi:hypothetical protein